MNTGNKAYINGKIIAWARRLNGITYEQIEKSLTVSKGQTVAWENGDALPTFNQAIELADVLHIPFGYLFLSEPPDVDIPLPDLRTRGRSARLKPSGNFLELLYQVLDKQEWYREYLSAHGAKALPFVSKFSLRDSVSTVAADLRKILHINADLRRHVGTLDGYLNALSANAEVAGITVLRSSVVGNNNKRRLEAEEFQGFAVSDNIAPFVFVNTDDFKTARIFTLVHELAHIWVGKSGISKTNEEGVTANREQSVEVFCNRVAAEALVPEAEFLHSWEDEAVPASQVARLVNEYKVSVFVILRRAHELNKIETREFKALVEAARRNIQKATVKGGGDFWFSVATRHSHRFMEAVLTDVRRGGTVWRDAARLLSVQVPTLMNFVERPE